MRIMALLHDSVAFKKFDTRMVERNMARGVIRSEDYSAIVKALPDDAENADWISIDSLMEDLSGEAPLSNGKDHDSY